MPEHEEDLVASKTEGFKVGEKKTINEYTELDKNDESLNRWKASLGLATGATIGDPSDPRKCIIKSLALEVEGRPDVVIDVSAPGAVDTLKDKPFTIKEGAHFRIKVVFQVHHEVLSGLKYLQVVKRKGVRVSKDEEMLGSYAPNTTDKPVYEKKFQEEEAPSGFIARGHYNAVSKFVDDDDHTHLQFHLPATTAVAAEYPNSFEAPSMTPVSSYNSAFNIQHTATPPSSQPYLSQYPQYLFENSPMLAQQPVANTHGWENNLQLLSSARMQHKASPSTSSTRSAPAGSSYQRSNASTLSKPLPTPVQTPIQNSFLAAPYQQNYDTSVHDGSQAEAEMVRRAVMEQQQKQQQQQSHHQHQPSDYSLAPSVSSVSHNSPVTPQIKPEELDEASKAMVNDYNNHNGNNLPIGIPKINRTMSDIYQDELYNPALMPTPQVSKQTTNQQNLLNPFRNVFADRLQAANQGHMTARSHSPVVNMHRDRSPFRQNSPLAAEYNNGFQQPQMATSVPMTQNVGQSQGEGEPKTMSPKDALLDFNEGDDAGIPLFPTSQPDFNLGEALGLRRESSSSFPQSQNFTSMESFPTQYTTPNGLPQQYPFAQQQQDHQQQQQNNLLHQTPEFPASLPHFESTNSDAGVNNGVASPPAQPTMAMRPVKEEITRPERTSADSGTYTCTYHGCTLRFETPTKLQKHKREAHRQTTPGGHLVGRDTSARNSQAGPHKCERINPSTGKPCNSVFSRPYDLTRHEDTIHNARKQKVRCHLCTEEKTFSRNDALTRHMRVVHPEVDWPGKQRRRGRE